MPLINIQEELRDNPLVWLGSPARRGIFRRVVMDVLLFLALTTITLAMLSFFLGGFFGGMSELGAFAGLLFVVAPPVVALMFPLFTPSWRTPERLVDMYLARLSPRLIAVGALVWPWVAGALVIFFFQGLFWTLLNLGNSLRGEQMLFSIFGAGLLLASISTLAICTKGWLFSRRGAWSRYLFAPFAGILIALGFVMLMAAFLSSFNMLSTNFFNHSNFLKRLGVNLLLYGVAGGVGLLLLRYSVRRAGTQIYAPVRPQDFFRAVWSAREKATRQLPAQLIPGQPEFWARLRVRAPRILGVSLLVLGAPAVAMGLYYFAMRSIDALSFLLPGGNTPIREFIVDGSMILTVAAAAFLATWLPNLVGGADGRVPIVAGRIQRSCILWLLLPFLVYAVIMSILCLLYYRKPTGMLDGWYDALVAAAISIIGGLPVMLAHWIAVLRTVNRRRWQIVYTVLNLGGTLMLMTMGYLGISGSAAHDWIYTAMALSGLNIVLLLVRIFPAYNCINEIDLGEIPAGHLNVTTPPQPHCDLVPDGWFKLPE